MASGDLRYRVGFYQRGAGGATGSPPIDWGMGGSYPASATFITKGNIEPRLGGEQIQAARLMGKNFVNVTVRKSTQTNAVDTDWICKNEDSGETFNIRSVIDPFGGQHRHGLYWEMLCEKGVAT